MYLSAMFAYRVLMMMVVLPLSVGLTGDGALLARAGQTPRYRRPAEWSSQVVQHPVSTGMSDHPR